MKCMNCSKPVGNWPRWLEDTSVTVRCASCAGAGAATVNAPKEKTVLTPLAEMAQRYGEATEAA